MRSRVAIAALTVVLLVAAAVASYFLERVEPQVTVEVAPPVQPVVVATPPPPRVAPPPAVAVAVPEVPEAPVVPSAVEEELPGPAQITHLAAASSTALRSACRKAVDACAERFPPWFSTSVTIDLDLEQHGEGSRIARAYTAAKSNGPASFVSCVGDALSNSDVPDLPIESAQMMVRCLPYTPQRTVFPSAHRVRDLLAKCLPTLPESDEVSVSFDVVNEGNVLKTGPLTLSGTGDVDAYARRCLELGLETRVPVSAGEAPVALPHIRLTATRRGGKYGSEFSYPPTKRD